MRIRENYARVAARRDLLYARVTEARDRLLSVQVRWLVHVMLLSVCIVHVVCRSH